MFSFDMLNIKMILYEQYFTHRLKNSEYDEEIPQSQTPDKTIGTASLNDRIMGKNAAVCSKAVVLLLLIYCIMYFPLFVGVLCLSLICYALLYIHSSFAIILKRKRKLVALLLLPYRCPATVNVLWLFLTVPWVGLQCMSVYTFYQ